MKAMILAAGRGERMRPLTEHRPKPLLKAAGRCLIEYQISRLVEAGITDIVINHSLYGDQIEATLGDGHPYGARIKYSPEGDEPLGTGGGIYKALGLLDGPCFVVVNGDVWLDYPLSRLPPDPKGLAHLVLVKNPAHNRNGDFALIDGRLALEGKQRLTFSGLGLYRPQLFDECADGRFSLTPVLRHAVSQGLVSGERHDGVWIDVGTPQRLAELERRLALRNLPCS